VYWQRDTLIPFFILSLVLHISFLLLSWLKVVHKETGVEPVPVSLLPLTEKKSLPAPDKAARQPPTRSSRAPAVLAKKSSRVLAERTNESRGLPEKEKKREEPAEPRNREEPPEDRNRPQEKTIVQRPLPTLKELLPPVASSPSEGSASSEGPIRLDTREPKYISYFDSIKRAIEIEWQYPEPALRQGLQGKLLLEFTVLGNGTLERARLLRSSGFPVLDEEAIRAVRAASPFHPIPPWIGKARLDIIASFEYHDNRLKYGFAP
jgi:periplasmic protein TonB